MTISKGNSKKQAWGLLKSGYSEVELKYDGAVGAAAIYQALRQQSFVETQREFILNKRKRYVLVLEDLYLDQNRNYEQVE